MSVQVLPEYAQYRKFVMNWPLAVSALFLCCSFVTKNAQAGVPTSRSDMNAPTSAPTPVQAMGAGNQTLFNFSFHLSKEDTILYSYKDHPKYLPDSHAKSMAFTQDGRYLNVGIRSILDKGDEDLYGGEYVTFDIRRFSDPVEVDETKFRHGFNYDEQYSPDGRLLVSINQDGQIRIDNVEDMKNPKHLSTLPWPDGQASCVTISRDGKFMVVGGRNKVFRVYDISNPLKPLEQSKTEAGHLLYDVALSPEGKWVVFVGNGFRLKVYDLSDLTAPKIMNTEKFPEDDDGVWTVSVAISPDSKWLAVAGYTEHHSLLIYNMESPGNPKLMRVEEIERPISFVDISRDGSLMAIGALGINSGVTIFDVIYPDQPLQVSFIKANNAAGWVDGAFSPVKDELVVDLNSKELELYKYKYSPDPFSNTSDTFKQR